MVGTDDEVVQSEVVDEVAGKDEWLYLSMLRLRQ